MTRLTSPTLRETGDLFFIGKAKDMQAALYGMAERAFGRRPEPFSLHPVVAERMERNDAH